jgi:hypothetical protein
MTVRCLIRYVRLHPSEGIVLTNNVPPFSFPSLLTPSLLSPPKPTQAIPAEESHIANTRGKPPTKLLERPPHSIPAATWHLNPDLNRAGPLAKEQLTSFFEDGYLFLPEFYSAEMLQEVQSDVSGMIDNLARRLHKAGKIKALYADLDWTSRLRRMTEDFADAPVVFIKGGVLPPSLQKLFAAPEILDVASQLGVGMCVCNPNPNYSL